MQSTKTRSSRDIIVPDKYDKRKMFQFTSSTKVKVCGENLSGNKIV
jgi:hypothetical protein